VLDVLQDSVEDLPPQTMTGTTAQEILDLLEVAILPEPGLPSVFHRKVLSYTTISPRPETVVFRQFFPWRLDQLHGVEQSCVVSVLGLYLAHSSALRQSGCQNLLSERMSGSQRQMIQDNLNTLIVLYPPASVAVYSPVREK